MESAKKTANFMRETCYFENVNVSKSLALETLQEDFFSIEINLVSSHHKSHAELYQCSICYKISYQLFECLHCQSITCSNCFGNYPKCTHRCPSEMIPISKKVVRSIKAINVKCPNEGCNNIITLEEMIKHEKACEFFLISCKQKGCNFVARKNIFERDHKLCPHELLRCKHCKNDFKRNAIDGHAHNCDQRILQCILNENCKIIIKACEMAKHVEICVFQKIVCQECEGNYLLKDQKQHSCVKYLKREMKKMKEIVHDLVKRLDIVEKKGKENRWGLHPYNY